MAAEPKPTNQRTYQDGPAVTRAVGDGRTLAATMPRLILEARRVAATVIHGLHGRRRAGPGENFWQYRRFVSGEPAARVDWRRSARDDHLYVREQEWEAAHTVWIWPDRSPSMHFASPLVRDTKLYRTLVVALALAEVLVEGGERVGIPGLTRPTGSRNVIDLIAQAIVHDRNERTEPAAEFRALPARRGRAAVRPVERDRRGAPHAHAAFRQRRARPRRADRRSGRGDFSLLGPHRIRRTRRRRPHHRRPRRDLARRLCRARRPASRRDPRARPTGSAGASPSIAPTGRRANFCSRCTPASAPQRRMAPSRLPAPSAIRERRHDRRITARLCRTAGSGRAV